MGCTLLKNKAQRFHREWKNARTENKKNKEKDSKKGSKKASKKDLKRSDSAIELKEPRETRTLLKGNRANRD